MQYQLLEGLYFKFELYLHKSAIYQYKYKQVRLLQPDGNLVVAEEIHTVNPCRVNLKTGR